MELRDLITNLIVAAAVYGVIFAPLDIIREAIKRIRRMKGRMPVQ